MSRTAKGEPFGQQWTIGAGTGCDLRFREPVTGPTVTAKYSKLWIPEFTESGADSLDLTVSPDSAESCQIGLGWRAEYRFAFGKYELFPEAHVSYQNEFLNDSRSIEAKLADTAFMTVTDKPTVGFILAGGGMVFRFSDSVLFGAGYQAQLYQNDFLAQGVNGNVKVYF